MQESAIHSCLMVVPVLFFILLTSGLFIPAAAADTEIEGYLGETITLHGVSYVGDSVYLFMTGPGLPVNGVTLTDTSLRADQGHFTIVGLDDNQEWTYIWKTSRISSEIDPGTYIVYVTNEPSDLAHLGGSSHYKTLSVFLKDSGVSKVSISAQHLYTRNPENSVSTSPEPSMNITSTTPAVTSPLSSTTIPATPVQTTVPFTARADTGCWAAMAALVCCVYLVSFLKVRP